jgi:TatD DNase family protein
MQLKGFMIGVGGTVTYKKSKLPEVLGYADINRILLETDAPFLTPQTYRGQRNQPVYLWEIAKKVAEIFQINAETVAKTTRFNTLKMFNI